MRETTFTAIRNPNFEVRHVIFINTTGTNETFNDFLLFLMTNKVNYDYLNKYFIEKDGYKELYTARTCQRIKKFKALSYFIFCRRDKSTKYVFCLTDKQS